MARKPPMRRWTAPTTPIVTIISHRNRQYHQAVARHQEHEMNLALSGAARYTLNEGPAVALAAGEILLMPAGTLHAIDVEEHLHLAAIHIHPKAFQALVTRRGPQKRLAQRLRQWVDPPPWRKVVAPEAFPMLSRLAEESVVEQNRRDFARASLLQALATQAAVHFLRLMLVDEAEAVADPATRRILSVRHWIDRHFAEPCNLHSLARRAHLAPTYFAARFRDVVGTPPMTYLRDRRIEQARLLLQRTGQPAQVIAGSVGFTDVSHFHHAFKQATGLTPAAYRAARSTSE